jgi:hypothetical protein
MDSVAIGTVCNDLNRIRNVAVGQDEVEHSRPLMGTTIPSVNSFGRAEFHTDR